MVVHPRGVSLHCVLRLVHLLSGSPCSCQLTHIHTFVFIQLMPCNVFDLRVLGSPNPGQSFGRGLSGPQATEVKMARSEVGRLRISPYIRLIHFWVPHFGSPRSDPIRELHFLMFSVFSRFQTRGRYVDPVVSWRTQLWKIPW